MTLTSNGLKGPSTWMAFKHQHLSGLLIFMASSGDTCINILGPAQLQNVAQKFHEAIIQIGFRSFGLQEKNSFYITRRGRKTNSIYNTFA